MANVSLSGMTVEALMDLRKRVDEMLLERRVVLDPSKRRPQGRTSSTGCAIATTIKSLSSSSLELRSFRAGMRAVLAGLDEGEFTDDPKWRTTEWNEEP